MIDVREGPNVRLSFDGFRVKSKIDSWRIDGLAVRPDLDKPGFFDNVPNHAVGFWGVYATRPLAAENFVGAITWDWIAKTATYDRGTARKCATPSVRGSRVPSRQNESGWDFDYEALWQFGTFGSGNIRAWTVASETGYRFPNVPLKPRFSVKADISSGDDPRIRNAGNIQSAIPEGQLFRSVGHYRSRSNQFHRRASAGQSDISTHVTASFDWIFQWRESLPDGVYAVPGFLIVPAGGSRARFVGNRPGMEVRWQAIATSGFRPIMEYFMQASF